jgi:hypothetical protein
MSRHRLYLASLLGTTMVLAGACGDDSGEAASETQTLRLYDFGFDMPDQVTGPLVDLEVVNDGAVAHEFAVAHVTAGTTAEQVLDALNSDDAPPDFILDDPGGVNLLGAGESLRYQRILEPGTYVFFCPFPGPGGQSSHADHGMATVFEVTDTNDDPVPDADATIALSDDVIEIPDLDAGTTSYAVTNEGSTPHEVYITGVPSDDPAAGTPDVIGEELGQWIEGGQAGPAPHDLHFPGGHQTIPPGGTVVLTMTLRPGHSYRFEDYSGDQPITATASTP